MQDVVTQRIVSVMKYYNLNENSFSKKIGVAQSTMNSYLSSSRKPSLRVIECIVNTFPLISSNWLLTGNGEMLKEEKMQEEKELDSRENVKDVKPRIPYDAKAGKLTEMVDGVTIAQCEMSPTVRTFPNYDFTIFVTGDSMIPKYISGDEVACLRINQASFIQWGRVHVIDTSQGILLKRIYDEGEYIRCVSFNSVEYPDFLIHKSDVWSYNLVVGLLRL